MGVHIPAVATVTAPASSERTVRVRWVVATNRAVWDFEIVAEEGADARMPVTMLVMGSG